MNKIKFLAGALALSALAFLGCEKENQIVTSPGLENENEVIADDNEPDLIPKSRAESIASSGQTIYGLTVANRLVQFSSDDPDEIISRRRITGLQSGERLLGIDFRPATGQLYGLGSSSRLYVIDTWSAQASPIGAQSFSPGLSGSAFGFDFNPTVDRIRIVSNNGQNLRVHPDLGTVVDFDPATAGTQTDLNLAYDNTANDGDPVDVNAGRTPSVVGAAYTNPDNNPATGTTLYDLDAALNTLVIQAPPNNGTLNTVATIAFNSFQENFLGFDIAPSGTAYVAGWDGRRNVLATLDLISGRVSILGRIDTRASITGLATPAP